MTTEPTREQIESLLACADTYRNGPYAPVKPDELRALCRAWLALHDAPVAEVRAHDELGDELPLVFVPDDWPIGKTVRLVAVEGG